MFVVQRDPRNFAPLPDAFLPERWLPREDQTKLEPSLFQNRDLIKHNTAAFFPFSTGPMGCIGKTLALMQMRMAICALVQRFDMHFQDDFNPKKWEDEMLDYVVMIKGSLPVVLGVRK